MEQNFLWNFGKKQQDRTEALIQKAYHRTKKKRIVLHPEYLDDERLPEEERTRVLCEIFNRNIREKQLERIACHMAPILDGKSSPSHLLAYGPTGSGKTVTLLHCLSAFERICEKSSLPFRYRYVDLTTPKTVFGALNEVAMVLAASKRYRKGIALEHMEDKIIHALSCTSGYVCLLIDEIDNISTGMDKFLTFIGKTLPKKVNARMIYIFLTNRLDWESQADPRILSFLKKTDVIFEPYDAMDLQEILKLRVEKALDSKKVDQGAIEKIAALACRETGDARKAIELLARAVRVAEEGPGTLTEVEVDVAESLLEEDKTQTLTRALPKQQKAVLLACYMLVVSLLWGKKRVVSCRGDILILLLGDFVNGLGQSLRQPDRLHRAA